jgi:hypothetical protein
MTLHQKIFAVACSLIIFLTIISLVKKGRLKEEFSAIWLLIGVVILVPVLWYDALVFFTRSIGAVLPTTTLFIFGIVFLLVLCLHFAIRISRLCDQVKNMAQQISLMETERRADNK